VRTHARGMRRWGRWVGCWSSSSSSSSTQQPAAAAAGTASIAGLWEAEASGAPAPSPSGASPLRAGPFFGGVAFSLFLAFASLSLPSPVSTTPAAARVGLVGGLCYRGAGISGMASAAAVVGTWIAALRPTAPPSAFDLARARRRSRLPSLRPASAYPPSRASPVQAQGVRPTPHSPTFSHLIDAIPSVGWHQQQQLLALGLLPCAPTPHSPTFCLCVGPRQAAQPLAILASRQRIHPLTSIPSAGAGGASHTPQPHLQPLRWPAPDGVAACRPCGQAARTPTRPSRRPAWAGGRRA